MFLPPTACPSVAPPKLERYSMPAFGGRESYRQITLYFDSIVERGVCWRRIVKVMDDAKKKEVYLKVE